MPARRSSPAPRRCYGRSTTTSTSTPTRGRPASCLGGDTDARANVDYETTAKITAPQGRDDHDRRPRRRGDAGRAPLRPRPDHRRRGVRRRRRRASGDYRPLRQIFFESTVIMLGEPNPELEVDESGRITKIVNVVVRDAFGNVYDEDDVGADDPGRSHHRAGHRLRPRWRRALLRQRPARLRRADGARRRDLGRRGDLQAPADVGLRALGQLLAQAARDEPDRHGQPRRPGDDRDRGRHDPRAGEQSALRHVARREHAADHVRVRRWTTRSRRRRSRSATCSRARSRTRT